MCLNFCHQFTSKRGEGGGTFMLQLEASRPRLVCLSVFKTRFVMNQIIFITVNLLTIDNSGQKSWAKKPRSGFDF